MGYEFKAETLKKIERIKAKEGKVRDGYEKAIKQLRKLPGSMSCSSSRIALQKFVSTKAYGKIKHVMITWSNPALIVHMYDTSNKFVGAVASPSVPVSVLTKAGPAMAELFSKIETDVTKIDEKDDV